MRSSSLLLALVAGAAANDSTQLRQPTERDLTLSSREPTRPASIKLGQRETSPYAHAKRDDDDPHNPFYYLHDIPNGKDPKNDDDDDDDDDDDNDDDKHNPNPGYYMNGGAIAGAVVGAVFGLFILVGLCYCLCIRPRRRQEQHMEAARKDVEVESTHPPTTPPRSPGNDSSSSSEHIHWVRTPYPRNVPSVQTTSTISGLALPTPAMGNSPSIAAVSPPLSPTYHHTMSDKPPAYAAVIALQSSEPQPEATAYQMGQVPVPTEPPMYQLPIIPAPGVSDMKGEPISRY
ncbi:uncharacterized protein F4822DRAFT_31649 [Hypoxylon trugodes]|uniref:uncharacterized protein n=1 Tax=Hypoxylon trugodes TaxID=326681 RepID=UPI00219A9808|nr:uncharacterized protein F4822DRAFT_31649 [Hypoxylon trugodes]KAI1393961.1 hypothetical protein F4822DRAFT_31649 [Hypoxylon trugodes]